jgi:hypothetical protein
VSQLELLYSTFSWNEVVFRSFQSDNLKRLDLDRYFQLKSAVSKRMFRFLDKRFYLNRTLKFDLREFSCEHIGLSRNNPPTKLKRHLQGALDELEAIGFLEPMGPNERYTKVQKGEWTIALVKRSVEAGPPKAEKPEKVETGGHERELIARGVTPASAAELVTSHAASLIQVKLEVFDWLMDRKDKRILKSPAGYLVKSIRDDYSSPKGFEAKAEKEARVAKEREQRLKAEEAKHRAEAEVKAREEAESVRVQAFWDALAPAEQEKLKEAALANANPFFHTQYRKEKGKNTESERRYLKLIIDMHIQEILSRETAKAAQ